MKPSRTASMEEIQLSSRFESLRRTLQKEQYRLHLEQTLSYWALPTDRRLPLAFLGRTLSDLLATPFVELAKTSGIGQKKLDSLVSLLARAANTDPTRLVLESSGNNDGNSASTVSVQAPAEFDPARVSEVEWGQWRSTVTRHGLGQEKLGRLTPSLQNLTRVIWTTPLEQYSGCTLADIRSLRTHGQKRVRAILEVFYSVHEVLGNAALPKHLALRLSPRLIEQAEAWVLDALRRPVIPSAADILEGLLRPLLDQLRIDAGVQLVELAESRLGINGPLVSVRRVARGMRLTRARVYQLLNEVNDILTVRWPNGRILIYELKDRWQAQAKEMPEPPDLKQFTAAAELFYPNQRRRASGSRGQDAMARSADETALVTVD
ncbi:MAG: hypothetical protein ACOY3P_16060 [Planctomycetota bacterium]